MADTIDRETDGVKWADIKERVIVGDFYHYTKTGETIRLRAFEFIADPGEVDVDKIDDLRQYMAAFRLNGFTVLPDPVTDYRTICLTWDSVIQVEQEITVLDLTDVTVRKIIDARDKLARKEVERDALVASGEVAPPQRVRYAMPPILYTEDGSDRVMLPFLLEGDKAITIDMNTQQLEAVLRGFMDAILKE